MRRWWRSTQKNKEGTAACPILRVRPGGVQRQVRRRGGAGVGSGAGAAEAVRVLVGLDEFEVTGVGPSSMTGCWR